MQNEIFFSCRFILVTILPFSSALLLFRYGNTEILITNLPKDVFKYKDIEKLYLLRWRIETSSSHLKNTINIAGSALSCNQPE